MVVPTFEAYKDKYKHARLRREDGILEVTFHTDGEDLMWAHGPHIEFPYLFEDIGRDAENKVVIFTGAGDNFINRRSPSSGRAMTPAAWQSVHYDAKRLILSQLDIEQPTIAAINGPATLHAELGLMCDITLAADHAYFADSPHAPMGVVPGDGVQILWPLLLGMNRGRYFLLTGQKLSASEARDLGVVNEVLPKADVLPRAWDLARDLRSRSPVAMRFFRTAMMHRFRKIFADNLGYGLAMEGIAAIDNYR